MLQRLAVLEQRQATLERRALEEGHADSVFPAGGRAEGTTDSGPFVVPAGDAPEGPAFPKESEGTLWQGTGSTRRLTAHGRQVLASMVTAGLPLAEMAARFGMRSDSMARTVRRMFPGAQTMAGQTENPEAGSS